jgi:hypothetical protein
MNAPLDLAYFRAFGFTVLRGAFDPGPLSAEIDRVLREGLVAPSDVWGGGEIHFRYVPMMSAETPVSLSLLDRLEAVAVTVLGGPVIPTRAKANRYQGSTPWHADSAFPVPSLGFAAYLEPLHAGNGALRVLPGSHRPEMAAALRALGAEGSPADTLPAHVVSTEPGDLIVFEEHLFHASAGGEARRQWRLDYLLDPQGPEAEAHTRAYFQSIYPPDWDGGYDVDRFPSYGPDWRASGRRAVARLEALGVYALAATQEGNARARRR